MAQTLFQLSKPNENNAVINTLPLVLWSSNRAEPQFKYVLDVYYDDSNTRLTRVKFTNNATFNNGGGVIDLAPIVRDYLDYDQPWKFTGENNFTQNVNARRFKFIGGEEYATSPSSSVSIYDGSGSVGEPAFTASQNNLFLAVHELDEGSYNWNFVDYAGKSLTNYQSNTSSDYPKKIYNGDYETISLMDNITGSGKIEINSIDITVRSGSTTLHGEDILITTSSADNNNMIRYVGVGPQNLSDFTSSFANAFTGSWTSYTVYFDVTIEDNTIDLETTYFYENGECTNYDRTRFAFINKLGAWDYYNIDLPLKRNTKLERKTSKKTHLQYQSLYGQDFGSGPVLRGGPVYKSDSRGLDQYYIQPTDTFNISSNWLNESEANWLTELIDSPSVFIQVDDNFQPINITKASYDWKTNPRGQKIFQYNITYQLSNQRSQRQ